MIYYCAQIELEDLYLKQISGQYKEGVCWFVEAQLFSLGKVKIKGTCGSLTENKTIFLYFLIISTTEQTESSCL